MTGTIRTFDPKMRDDVHARIQNTVTKIAEAWGAEVQVDIRHGYPVTFNDPELTATMAGVLDRVSAGGKAIVAKPIMGAEDFSYFANQIPGLFIGIGVAKDGAELSESASNHSPYFYVNDKALPVGIEALSQLALTWLEQEQAR